MIDYAAARLTMVDSQLRPNRVTDEAVLDAFLAVPRERFVPPALHGIAYVDGHVPLGGGRCLMAPMMLARLLQEAAIRPGDTILDIGCATGYGCAILARLAREVVGIEADPDLAAQAQTRLRELGAANANIIDGDMASGYPARAPYQVIVVEGAVAEIPEAIANQLAEGGRLVTVVQDKAPIGRAVLMARTNGVLTQRPIFDAAIPFLPGFQRAPSFVF